MGRSGAVKVFSQALFEERGHVLWHVADRIAAARIPGGLQALVMIDVHQDISRAAIAGDGYRFGICRVQKLTGIARDG